MFPAASDITDDAGHLLVTAYALHRPGGEWSLMLVNRDPSNPHPLHIVFDDSAGSRQGFFSGAVTQVTFGSEQYVWHPDGPRSHADPDDPPVTTTISSGAGTVFTLPKASVTVLRGKIQGLADGEEREPLAPAHFR